MLPILWLNGQQLTGLASDPSPVLANCILDWGADSDIDHQGAASFVFQVLFRGGSQDIAGLQRGAEIELTYDNITVFAGTIRSATATSSPKGLLTTVNCIEHLADVDSLFTQTEWIFETSSVRWLTLKNLFESKGYELEPRALSTGLQEANSYYDSIKVLTLLERFLASDGRLTRWDSSRRIDGVLHKSVRAGYRGESSGSNRLETEGPVWVVEYSADTNTGVITWLDASNVIRSDWKLEPGTSINSLKLSYQVTEQDPETGKFTTNLSEATRNDTASIAEFGTNAAEVTISSHGEDLAATLDQVAASWYRQDMGWTLEQAEIYDTKNVTHERMLRILDNRRRSQNLVIVRGVTGNTPNDTASNVRASLIGGRYVWNGDEWEATLSLGRNQDFTAPNQWTFLDVAGSSNPAISQGTAESIGNEVTFADFKQISKD